MKRNVVATALGVCALALCGCNASQQADRQITAEYVRNNMSPELESIAETPAQRANRHARVDNTNLRQIPDDIDMLLLRDRPVWLSWYPVD